MMFSVWYELGVTYLRLEHFGLYKTSTEKRPSLTLQDNYRKYHTSPLTSEMQEICLDIYEIRTKNTAEAEGPRNNVLDISHTKKALTAFRLTERIWQKKTKKKIIIATKITRTDRVKCPRSVTSCGHLPTCSPAVWMLCSRHTYKDVFSH